MPQRQAVYWQKLPEKGFRKLPSTSKLSRENGTSFSTAKCYYSAKSLIHDQLLSNIILLQRFSGKTRASFLEMCCFYNWCFSSGQGKWIVMLHVLKSVVTVPVNCKVYRTSNRKTTTILPTERFFGWSTNMSSSKQPSSQGYRGTTKWLEKLHQLSLEKLVLIIHTSCEINTAKQIWNVKQSNNRKRRFGFF